MRALDAVRVLRFLDVEDARRALGYAEGDM